MKASFYFYKGKIKSLPAGIFALVILLVILLIPVIVSLLILTTVFSLLVRKVLRTILPTKKPKVEYTDYEIVEEIKEKKRIQ